MSKVEQKKKPENKPTETKAVAKPELTEEQKQQKKFEELKDLIKKQVEKEGKGINYQILNGVTKTVVLSYEKGTSSLDDAKIGDNMVDLARISAPTNEDYKKVLVQVARRYLELEVKVREEKAKAEKEESVDSGEDKDNE